MTHNHHRSYNPQNHQDHSHEKLWWPILLIIIIMSQGWQLRMSVWVVRGRDWSVLSKMTMIDTIYDVCAYKMIRKKYRADSLILLKMVMMIITKSIMITFYDDIQWFLGWLLHPADQLSQQLNDGNQPQSPQHWSKVRWFLPIQGEIISWDNFYPSKVRYYLEMIFTHPRWDNILR